MTINYPYLTIKNEFLFNTLKLQIYSLVDASFSIEVFDFRRASEYFRVYSLFARLLQTSAEFTFFYFLPFALRKVLLLDSAVFPPLGWNFGKQVENLFFVGS